MSTEHRRHARYPVEVAAEITTSGSTLVAATQNISEGGVGLVLDRPLEPGQQIALTLFLTQDGIEDPDEEPFEARAKVAWSKAAGDTHVVGVELGAITPAQRAQLTRFIAAVS